MQEDKEAAQAEAAHPDRQQGACLGGEDTAADADARATEEAEVADDGALSCMMWEAMSEARCLEQSRDAAEVAVVVP